MRPMRFPALASLACGAILLAACGGSASPASSPSAGGQGPVAASASSAQSPALSSSGAATKMRFGINTTSVSSSLYLLIQSAGIFAKNGLDVDLVQSAGRTSLNGVIAGELQGLSLGGPSTVLIAIQQGAAMHIVAVPSDVYNVIIVSTDNITSLEQLKGKKIGGQSETAIDVTGIKRALHDVGLDAGTGYQFVDTGAAGSGTGVLAALLAHQIDAAPLDDVTTQAAMKQKGFRVLMDMADPNLHLRTAFSVVALRDDFVQRGDTAQRFVDSLVQGMAYMRDHKTEAVAAIHTQTKIDDPAELDKVYARQVQLLAKDVTPVQDEFADAITYVPKGTAPIPASQMASSLDPRLAQAAVKRAS